MNYSYLEMIHYIQDKVADGEVMKNIKDVLTAFLNEHYKEIGFSSVIISNIYKQINLNKKNYRFIKKKINI